VTLRITSVVHSDFLSGKAPRFGGGFSFLVDVSKVLINLRI
jgi:hypothetical protein